MQQGTLEFLENIGKKRLYNLHSIKPSPTAPGTITEKGFSDMNIVITGANRGIGLELCRQYMERGEQVIATCRQPNDELSALSPEIVKDIDVTDGKAGDKIRKALKDRQVDILINNAGIMESVQLDHLDLDSIRRQFEINTLGPLHISAALLDNMPRGSRIGIITSRMGSIDDNTSGGSYGYRLSKAAANMAGRSLAHDLRPREIAVALLHPGWVRTRMTGYGGLIDPDESAAGLIKIMDRLDLSCSGLFWHTNGEQLPW